MSNFENYLDNIISESTMFYRNDKYDGVIEPNKANAKLVYFSKRNAQGKTDYFVKKGSIGNPEKILQMDYNIARDGILKYSKKNPEIKDNLEFKKRLNAYNKNLKNNNDSEDISSDFEKHLNNIPSSEEKNSKESKKAIQYYDEANKLCNEILKLNPKDKDIAKYIKIAQTKLNLNKKIIKNNNNADNYNNILQAQKSIIEERDKLAELKKKLLPKTDTKKEKGVLQSLEDNMNKITHGVKRGGLEVKKGTKRCDTGIEICDELLKLKSLDKDTIEFLKDSKTELNMHKMFLEDYYDEIIKNNKRYTDNDLSSDRIKDIADNISFNYDEIMRTKEHLTYTYNKLVDLKNKLNSNKDKTDTHKDKKESKSTLQSLEDNMNKINHGVKRGSIEVKKCFERCDTGTGICDELLKLKSLDKDTLEFLKDSKTEFEMHKMILDDLYDGITKENKRYTDNDLSSDEIKEVADNISFNYEDIMRTKEHLTDTYNKLVDLKTKFLDNA